MSDKKKNERKSTRLAVLTAAIFLALTLSAAALAAAERKIALALQRNSAVYAYDAKGSVLFYKYGVLLGYTQDTVSVKQRATIYVYDATGKTLYVKYE
jgi:predicted nucleic acid-binding protein